MSTIRLIAIGVAGAAFTACQQGPKPLAPADEAAVRAADSTIVAAINAGNVDAATAGYTADGTILAPGAPIATGTEGIRQLWKSLMDAATVNLVIKQERVAGAGNIAYNIGSYRISGTMKDSARTPMPTEDGKYLQVFVKQSDGSWKMTREIYNSDLPLPTPAPPPSPGG